MPSSRTSRKLRLRLGEEACAERGRRRALFGFRLDAALATVVGVLVEVPVMLSVVRIVLRTRC
jgi:hypothetical protein